MTHALNARQEAFCRHYVLGASAAAAAREAGYAAATARSQAWRLLQQPAVQARIEELRADRAAAAAALCGRLWAQVDAIRDAALAKGQHGAALRAVTTQLRLFERLGLPARAADTYDILVEGAAAEAGAALTDVDIAALSEAPAPAAAEAAEPREPSAAGPDCAAPTPAAEMHRATASALTDVDTAREGPPRDDDEPDPDHDGARDLSGALGADAGARPDAGTASDRTDVAAEHAAPVDDDGTANAGPGDDDGTNDDGTNDDGAADDGAADDPAGEGAAAGGDPDAAQAADPEMAALLRAALTEALGDLGGAHADRRCSGGNVLPFVERSQPGLAATRPTNPYEQTVHIATRGRHARA